MKSLKVVKFVISLALPLALGAIAGIFTSQAIPEWYSSLNRPSFNPPNWIFGPVWTTLYLLLGISFFLIWDSEAKRERYLAIWAFSIQMFLNFIWSFLFFYFNQIGIALVEILLLWLSIFYMMYRFYRINPVSAYMNIPYLLWVSFAAILNAAYYFLN